MAKFMFYLLNETNASKDNTPAMIILLLSNYKQLKNRSQNDTGSTSLAEANKLPDAILLVFLARSSPVSSCLGQIS